LQQLKQAVLLQRAKQSQSVRKTEPGRAPIARVDRSAALALSYAQQRLWFLDQFDHAAGAAYHMPAALRLTGQLDKPVLRRVLDRIVARHESLRTCFVDLDGMPVQQIAAAGVGMALGECDLSQLAGDQRESAMQRLSDDEAVAPFDLAAGPLIRGQLLRLAGDEHVLLITQHHIISDGWSIGVLVREISALYAAFSAGQADPLPPLAIQYADYAAWQRGWLQGDVLHAQSAFWKEQLTGAPALLELPSDRPRPAQQSYAGASVALTLDAPLTAGLKALGQKHGATLFMTLLAGWAALLARLSGQDDVVVGTPVANRQRTEVEGLIGFFVNTLALRVKLDGDPTVAQLLAQVKAHTLGAYDHQDLPFEQVVEAAQPVRSMSHSPLFQVMLSLDNAPGGELQLPGLRIGAIEPKRTTAQFDLTLSLAEHDGQLDGSLRYASDLFDQATIVRMAGHLETLLRAMVADDGARVASLALLSTAQRHQLLHGFNQPLPADAPQHRLVHQLFEAQVLAHPDAIALVVDDVTLSYAELNRRANRLAHYLRGLGVGADQRVALCLERGADMVVAILATLKAGGGYVPLDPAYPADRLAYMIEDSAPAALLTQASLADQVPHGAATVVLIDGDGADAAAIAQQPDSNPDCAGLAPHHLAYIIYTSGSTGHPKGVMIEHRNVSRLFDATAGWYGFNENDVWTLFHSFAFDFSVWELWGALLYGGRLVVVPYLVSRSPQEFYALLCEQGVTVLNQTPSAFRQLVAAQADSAAAHQLRTVVFGGEALDLASLRPWYRDARNGATLLVNMYGITETTVHVTYRALAAADAELAGASPIGQPLPDLQVYILDAQGEPAPIGVTGELYVGGAGVARGYLNRPELNAERFVADRFDGAPGARLYKTGDVARRLADGGIDYIGRIDFQVKIRGFRIELGEIEARLLACDGVQEAIVIAREDEPGQKRLVAYLRTQPGAAPSAAALNAQLGQHLAGYMIPSAFVTLDAFPLTANGKLDRKALPAPDQDALARSAYVAPQGALEQALCQAWSAVLKVDAVGVDDNYFDIGGDSIRSIAIVAQARTRGVELAIVDIFRHPTVRSLALALAARQGEAVPEEPLEILGDADRALLPAQVEDAYPMTLLQMGMVFHNQLEQNAGLYHDVFSNHVTLPAWDEAALRRVLAAMAVRHPVLRTGFDLLRYSEPLQLVWRDAEVPLTVIDLRALDTAQQDRTVAAFVDAERKSSFELGSAPLLRIFVHLRAAQLVQYTFSFHHAILDGWSVASFQTEMFNAYFAALEGKDVVPAPLALTPKAAALREKQALGSERHRRFWRDYLDGHVYSALPPAEEVVDTASMDRNRTVKVSEAVCTRLQALAAELAVPMRTVLLSAHLRVVSMLAGKDDVTTGLVSNVRPEAQDGEKVLGLFLNTLPLRQQLARGCWKDLVKATYANELAVIEHRHYPYFQLHVDNGRNPYYEIVFNFINFHVYDDLKAGPQQAGYNQAFEATGFDLGVNINYNAQRGLHLELKPGKLGGAQTERILGYYLAVLAAMAADPEAAHDEHHFLGEAEARRLLVELHGNSVAYPQNELIHQQFEAHAAATPDALALGHEAQALTYAQLNARANQLAHHLVALGVRPDDRVAICMERGIDMLVGLLGIWKAGGAYVPLDPAYPQERLVYMLEDSAPAALLTQAALADKFATPLRKVLIDGAAEMAAIAACAIANPAPAALGLHAGHLAYVIYTSGSTGKPKGAMLSHAGVSNFARAQIAEFGTGPGSRVLQFFSFSFDACVSEITMALCAGASLFLASRDDLMVGEPLLGTIQRHAITHISLPPPVLAALPHDADLGALQALISGGEAYPPALADHWGARYRCFNVYGPTEATVIAASYRYQPLHGETMPIGKPLANTAVYILDSHLRPVPLGVTGELHIGGVQVARGYLHRPQLTAERFIADPFSGRPDARLYKSGDLARWMPDGNIDFVGRNDQQVKIRGFRIELGEIEARLLALPGVREALVIARDGGASSADKRLIAYLTADGGASLTAAGLRAALSQQLAEHMLPSAFVVLDAFPLTPNGKIDRKALPAAEAARTDADYTAPRNDMEQLLCGAFADVLKLARAGFGIHDHFFERGGNSLLIVKLHGLLAPHYPQRLAIADYFKYPTVARLAEYLGRAASEAVTRVPDSLSRAELRKSRMTAQRDNRLKRAV
jgi:amino acid adenylation domain-containing protein